MENKDLFMVYCTLALGAVAVTLGVILDKIDVGQAIYIIVTIVLVAVTAVYAIRTSDIAKATKEQAEASIKMANEMREQRIIESRPVIIQKAETIQVIPSEHSTDHFEIYNAGNGPAIEVEISLVLQKKPPYTCHNSQREGFLRAGDKPIEFHTTFPTDISDSTFYIVSEYQGISSNSSQPTWYQTWLPCKLSVSGKVISGKLEFKEVSEKNRINIFNSELNNGSKND